MTPEQIDEALRSIRDRAKGSRDHSEETLLSLAKLSVSMLRMIDARRERGVTFDASYNEQVLRQALASMSEQDFPPGPPMVPAALGGKKVTP